ncbi:hypothetical protein VTH06DRAFT_7280 [Thermothelomyces fergusii]|jgi:sideroflexin-5
MLDD